MSHPNGRRWRAGFTPILVVAFAMGCATPPPGSVVSENFPVGSTESSPPKASDRKISTSDTLNIVVVGEEELSGDFRVEVEGSIKFPYITEKVSVAGQSTAEVALLLEGLLRPKVLKNPKVQVTVKSYRYNGVGVFGSVVRQGTIELLREVPMNIVDAIGQAGGFLPVANKNRIELTRDGKTYRYKFDELIHESDPTKKIVLEPGDVIVVPESPF